MFVPLTIAALGIVLRGASFAFRKGVVTVRFRRVFGGAFALSSVLVPFCFGAIAGGLGGWADTVVMRFMDIMLAVPGLLLAIGIVAMLGPGLLQIMIAIGVVQNPNAAYVRGLSFIPFLTPSMMIFRIVTKMPPIWEIIATYVVMILSTGGVAWIASKIFRTAILLTGIGIVAHNPVCHQS